MCSLTDKLAEKEKERANSIGNSWRPEPGEIIEELPSLFSDKREREAEDWKVLQAELYRQIGQLKLGCLRQQLLTWLKPCFYE